MSTCFEYVSDTYFFFCTENQSMFILGERKLLLKKSEVATPF